MTITKERLADIKARAEAATLMPSHRSLDERFVAHAIVDIPDLVAEIENLRESIRDATYQLDGDGNEVCIWCSADKGQQHFSSCEFCEPDGELK